MHIFTEWKFSSVGYCRIAYFAKGGGDAYLFDMQFPNVPESVTRSHINVSNGKNFIVTYFIYLFSEQCTMHHTYHHTFFKES